MLFSFTFAFIGAIILTSFGYWLDEYVYFNLGFYWRTFTALMLGFFGGGFLGGWYVMRKEAKDIEKQKAKREALKNASEYQKSIGQYLRK